MIEPWACKPVGQLPELVRQLGAVVRDTAQVTDYGSAAMRLDNPDEVAAAVISGLLRKLTDASDGMRLAGLRACSDRRIVWAWRAMLRKFAEEQQV